TGERLSPPAATIPRSQVLRFIGAHRNALPIRILQPATPAAQDRQNGSQPSISSINPRSRSRVNLQKDLRGPVRFAWQSDYLGCVGADRWIGPQHLPELLSRRPRSHREREEIDGLIRLWAEKVGTEDSTARGFNQDLEP